MTFATLFLIYECFSIKKKALQLNELKNNYAAYVQTLKKRFILEYDRTKDSQDLEVGYDEKKVDLDKDLVNRNNAYLISCALSFGKKHGIESEVRELYTVKDFTFLGKKKAQKKPLKPKARKRENRDSLVSADLKFSDLHKKIKAKKEPIFRWPIAKSQFWLSAFFRQEK